MIKQHKQFNLPYQASEMAREKTETVFEAHQQYYLQPKVQQTPTTPGIDSPNIYRLDKTLNIKDQIILNDVQLVNKLGLTIAHKVFSSSTGNSVYSIATNEYLLGITSVADAPTVGLPKPSLAGVGKTFIVKDASGGAGTTTITIVSVGEETVDGASSKTITANYGSVHLYTDGANWFTF